MLESVKIILDYYYSLKHYSFNSKNDIHLDSYKNLTLFTHRENQLYSFLVKGYCPFKKLITLYLANSVLTIFDGKYYLDISFKQEARLSYYFKYKIFRTNHNVREICSILLNNMVILRTNNIVFNTENKTFINNIYKILDNNNQVNDTFDITLNTAYKYPKYTFDILSLI